MVSHFLLRLHSYGYARKTVIDAGMDEDCYTPRKTSKAFSAWLAVRSLCRKAKKRAFRQIDLDPMKCSRS